MHGKEKDKIMDKAMDRPTIASVLRDFAFYGHVESPLTCNEIERAISAGLDSNDIYNLGCDCACGYRFKEVFDLYL